MAKIPSCQDREFECDSLCASSEEELLRRAAQYAKIAQNLNDIPPEFREWVRAAMRDVDRG